MVVDESALRRRARDYLQEFRSRWPRSDVAFASKSFPCTAIQRLMTEEGLHLDVAGGGEIVTAVAAGADPSRMVLHGNAKTDEELELAIGHGVGLVVVDNFDDIDRLERLVPPGRVQACLVRVIPGGVTADTHASVATGHSGSKFGLSPPAMPAPPSEGSNAAPCCVATDSTLTSGPSCSTSTSWRPPSHRWPRSAPSMSTTWVVGWACATPTTKPRPPWASMPRRWWPRPRALLPPG